MSAIQLFFIQQQPQLINRALHVVQRPLNRAIHTYQTIVYRHQTRPKNSSDPVFTLHPKNCSTIPIKLKQNVEIRCYFSGLLMIPLAEVLASLEAFKDTRANVPAMIMCIHPELVGDKNRP